ncbi:MAG: response regulator [Isosphaeraceae bacterium]
MYKGTPILILLIEDDSAHAEIVFRSMADRRLATRIIHVQDGQEGLDYLERKNGYAPPADAPRPDVILLNLRLPRVDGLEVLRRIKSNVDICSIPVVVLTTSEAEDDVVKAYGNGASSYLVKPVDVDKFTKLLELFGFSLLAWNQSPHADRPPG